MDFNHNNLKELIKKHYCIQLSSINKINIQSLNELFYLTSDSGQKYILKLYTSGNQNVLENTKLIQEMIRKNIGISPKVYENKYNRFVSKKGKLIFSLEDFVNGTYPNCNESVLLQISTKLSLLHKTFKKIGDNKVDFKVISKNEIHDKLYKDYAEIDEFSKINTNVSYIDRFKKLILLRLKVLDRYDISYSNRYYQLIHNDFRPSNCLIDDKRFYVIDFDFASLGDVLVEILRSAILFSNFNRTNVNLYLKNYFKCMYPDNPVYSIKNLSYNLLCYLVNSSFPIYLHTRLEDKTVINIIDERIQLIKFCVSAINEVND